jgi:hypothetical protein
MRRRYSGHAMGLASHLLRPRRPFARCAGPLGCCALANIGEDERHPRRARPLHLVPDPFYFIQ